MCIVAIFRPLGGFQTCHDLPVTRIWPHNRQGIVTTEFKSHLLIGVEDSITDKTPSFSLILLSPFFVLRFFKRRFKDNMIRLVYTYSPSLID